VPAGQLGEVEIGPAGRPVSRGKDGKAITNRFGLEEYFALQKELGNQTILVVNLRDALVKKRPLAEAARIAAGMVAYTNAEVGQRLPAGMVDWPAVRAKNGRLAVQRVKYFQLGNEAWLMAPPVLKEMGLNDEAGAAWLRRG
jgi:alpha-L-arabinofuranosidase